MSVLGKKVSKESIKNNEPLKDAFEKLYKALKLKDFF